MAVQTPFSGLLFMHRLLRMSTPGHRRLRGLDLLHRGGGGTRTVSTFPVKCTENTGDSSAAAGLLLPRRRRPLSPLERISSLLPRDALSPEVTRLMEQDPEVSVTPEEEHGEVDPVTPSAPPALPGESAVAFGELLVAEYRRKERVEFRKMFELQPGARLQSSWGVIPHDDVAGHPAGRFLKTSRGVRILVRRASLDDYALYMKRGPAIAYPKDVSAMLMMMDVTEGDCILESGSGSGAMSLFLSRAVGCRGRVLSVEVREDHHKRAVLNYKRWRASWSLRRGQEWPDNVQFHMGDLGKASPLLAARGFHAVALDLINPQLVLPAVIPHLHPGAVCAIYLANITQVIDLLEGVRCMALPLLCERIAEVSIRDWVVAPALRKDGRYCSRIAPVLDQDQREEADREETTAEEHQAFGSVPYIARPHPEQMGHSAFLVKLRKCVR